MGREFPVTKRYIVDLGTEERTRLETMIQKGKHRAQTLTKARILLLADISHVGPGFSDARIIEALNTNQSTVHRTRKQLVEEGLDATLGRKQRATPAVEKIFDGVKEAKLIALACSQPPDGHARWTLRLLESKVVELGIVEHASDTTIHRVLKKTNSSRTVVSTG